MNTKKTQNLSFSFFMLPFAFLFAAAVFAFTACSSHSEGAAITTELGFVDILINQGDTKGAMDLLKKTEKLVSSPDEYLGLYKRYKTLGEDSYAENTLKKALRRFKKDEKILAVYGNMLLNQGNVKKAIKLTKPLSGTEYGSVYAQAFLQNALDTQWDAEDLFGHKFFLFKGKKKNPGESLSAEQKFEVFYDRRFIPVYLDASRGTKLSRWARNAASLYMQNGEFAKAAGAYTGHVDSLEDSLFWGAVFFDSGHYTESLEALVSGDQMRGLLAHEIEHDALEADDYYILGEDEASERIRTKLITKILSNEPKATENISSYSKKILPIVYVNSAIYLKSQDDPVNEYKRLETLISKFPDYEPGLASYGEYALYIMRRPPEDSLEKELRVAGLRTLSMEETDRIPKITCEDALQKIGQSLERKKNPKLVVIQEELKAQMHLDWETEKKASVVWPLLEQNASEKPSLYPDDIAHYAVVVLLTNGHEDDAEDLFNKYEQAVHAEEGGVKFEPSQHPESLNLWECEAAAWFYAKNGLIENSKILYDHIIKTYSNRSPIMNSGGQSEAVTNAYVNMANIYSGTGQGKLALDSLKKASARTLDEELKADVLYRIGREYYYEGDYKNAIRSLQYSLNQNEGHNKVRNKARLILKQAMDKNK